MAIYCACMSHTSWCFRGSKFSSGGQIFVLSPSLKWQCACTCMSHTSHVTEGQNLSSGGKYLSPPKYKAVNNRCWYMTNLSLLSDNAAVCTCLHSYLFQYIQTVCVLYSFVWVEYHTHIHMHTHTPHMHTHTYTLEYTHTTHAHTHTHAHMHKHTHIYTLCTQEHMHTHVHFVLMPNVLVLHHSIV